MDELLQRIENFSAHSIFVHFHSYPHFCFEIFLAVVVCIVHCLQIFEVNRLYRKTNARAAAKIRMRRPLLKAIESSYGTLPLLQHQILARILDNVNSKYGSQEYIPIPKSLGNRKAFSPNFDPMISEPEVSRHSVHSRLEHLLSISPSEYVRKDIKRNTRQACLKTCIQSLTSLLEKALNNDNFEFHNKSKEAIQNSINVIRENFKTHISRENFQVGDFGTPSLHSLIAQSVNKKALRHILSPPIDSRMVLVSNLDDKPLERDFSEYKNKKRSMIDLCKKRSSSYFIHVFKDV